jgi:4'-phosphopantetheinyl transferase
MELNADEVHVWLARSDLLVKESTQGRYQALLTNAEWQRVQRQRSADGQNAALLARVLQRWVLGHYTGVEPSQWRFGVEAAGKPVITSPQSRLAFNLSHSGQLVVCAVSRLAAVGVDVELPRAGVDSAALARRFFSTAETAALAGLPQAAQAERFYHLWTLKEAYIKLTGQGLAAGLDGFSFDLDAGGQIHFRAPPESPLGAGRPVFWLLQAPLGHWLAVAALSAQGGGARLRLFGCEPLARSWPIPAAVVALSESAETPAAGS